MLNGYAFTKRLEEFKKMDGDQSKESRFKNKHIGDREQLALNYKSRVEKFIQDMSLEPMKITNYKPQENNFRMKEDRSKMLGDALIRTKSFVTEKVRIQQSIEHYKNLLDTEGSVNKKMVHEFRERDVSKEIQPKMRFTASTQLERVIDAITQNRNSMENKDNKNPKKNVIAEMVVDQIKSNLIGSHQKHQNEKLINRAGTMNQDPTRDTNKSGVSNDQQQIIPRRLSQKELSPLNLVFQAGSDKLKTFYSTTSSSRLRRASSQYMSQNHVMARYINKEYKKLHFKAAQSVSMHAPGVLQSPTNPFGAKQGSQAVSPNTSVRQSRPNESMNSPVIKNGGDVLQSAQSSSGFNHTQQSFLQRQKNSTMLNTSKSAFFLPIAKPTRNKNESLNQDGTEKNFYQTHHSQMATQSHFQLPQVVNPIAVSKEKQQEMSKQLEVKSLNPYQQRRKKHSSHSQNERQKIEALMQASYMESSFYNMYYRNSVLNDPKGGSKKLRFAGDIDQDDSNFGLDVPSLEIADSLDKKTQGKPLIKKNTKLSNDNPHNITSTSQIDLMATEMLNQCNAVVNSKISHDKILKKGEGKTTSGSGKTNLEIYSQLMQTF
ncbi:UNKNOWN [Stylonychia lemnae]|uniref:Uncharacterized protein n=1 Tax=Stylonychia lemnae TaxID=5949 RepID=A0A078B7H3_STYLE|nr:UNKNOWN [Stylonychia lemnae]|eukprot:CDW89488.1 UNKNOWN [Stylonychia lemnae]